MYCGIQVETWLQYSYPFHKTTYRRIFIPLDTERLPQHDSRVKVKTSRICINEV